MELYSVKLPFNLTVLILTIWVPVCLVCWEWLGFSTRALKYAAHSVYIVGLFNAYGYCFAHYSDQILGLCLGVLVYSLFWSIGEFDRKDKLIDEPFYEFSETDFDGEITSSDNEIFTILESRESSSA